MKKSKIYLIVISLLIVIAAIFNYTRNNQTSLGDGSDFKIQDTSLVNKIFLADKKTIRYYSKGERPDDGP